MFERRWISPQEAGEVLGLDRRTVYRRLRIGDLPAARLGSGKRAPWRVDLRALEAELAGQFADRRRRRLKV